MSPENLKIFLSKKFDLLLFIDLADILEQHRTVFDVFKSIYRPAFDSDHRIVFYTDQEPEQKLIDHIQRAASQIDISSFFILIVCPYRIEKKLSLASARFGDINMPMQSMIVSLTGSLTMDQTRVVKTNTLCPLPFISVTVLSNNSLVSPCCKFQGSIGNLTQQTLTEIFHGAHADRIRHQMIQGQAPSECEICWKIEESGSKSLRSHSIDKYGRALDQSWLDDPQIRDITWSPSILCNFKCRICSSNNSSSIASEDIKFSHDLRTAIQLRTKLKQSLKVSLSDKAQILSCAHLKYLHILGGEPFLLPELESIIDDLISSGKSRHIHLEFNSNVSVYNDSLMHKIINNFASLEILLSIDNIGEKFEIERGGLWSEVKHNIQRFATLNGGNTQIKLAPTVNIQNVLYLDAVCDFAQSLGLNMVWWYLEKPSCLCIDYVTEAAKQLIINKYQHSPINELQKIVNRLQQAPMSDGKSFVEYVRKYDSRRNENFQITHKEIFEAMKSC
jgi:sulfatase maturation enzyme AslB (radical SAM superfamily)